MYKDEIDEGHAMRRDQFSVHPEYPDETGKSGGVSMEPSPPVGSQPDKDICADKVPAALQVLANRRLIRTVMNKVQSRS